MSMEYRSIKLETSAVNWIQSQYIYPFSLSVTKSGIVNCLGELQSPSLFQVAIKYGCEKRCSKRHGVKWYGD